MRNVALAFVAGGFLVACGSESHDHDSNGTNSASNQGSTTGGNGELGGPTTPSSACGQQTFAISATAVPPNVYLLVDRSGSMAEGFGDNTTGSKWDAAQAAIKGLLTDDTGQALWGLSLFPATPTQQDKCGKPDVDVPLAMGDEQAILTKIDSLTDQEIGSPAGETPTADALATVRDSANLTDTTRDNFLVLVTDGIPNCNNAADVAPVIDTLYSRSPSVKTFVVGLGGDTKSNPMLLNAWAEAGHTALTGTTEYYQANSATDLATAFSTIIGQAASCSFHLDKAPTDPTLVVGTINGVAQPNSPTNGYQYDATTQTLVFSGAACAQITSGKVSAVGADYGCPSAPIQ